MIINPYRFGAAVASLNDGLVSFWPLNENTTGTRTDYVDGNDLTSVNTVPSSIVAPIVYSRSALFTAANSEELTITDASQTGLNPSGSFTASCWVRGDTFASSTSTGFLMKYLTTGNQRGYALYQNTSPAPNRLSFAVSSDGTFANATTVYEEFALVVNTWYHLAVVYDDGASTIELFRDGSSVASGSHSGGIHASTDDFRLGNATFGAYFDGRMEAVGFWSRALDSSEITQLADETEPFYDDVIV